MENLVPIGRFSSLCRLTVKALRCYDDLGLLKPAVVKSDFTGQGVIREKRRVPESRRSGPSMGEVGRRSKPSFPTGVGPGTARR